MSPKKTTKEGGAETIAKGVIVAAIVLFGAVVLAWAVYSTIEGALA